ncbi:MAG: hypothetical protein AB7O73_00950 [Bacteroidia bacterium]
MVDKYKYDKIWIGLIIGVIFPWIIFGLYYFLLHDRKEIQQDDIHYLLNQELLLNVFKICCGTNLLWFYIGLNKKMTNFTRGIIGSVLVYALIIAYLTFFSFE